MVNEVVYNYLKAYKDKYPLRALKKKILSRGYSESEFREALNSLKKPVRFPKKQAPIQNLQQVNVSSTQGQASANAPPANFQPKQFPSSPQNFLKVEPRPPFKGFKWMKFAGICGIILILGLLSTITSSYLSFDIGSWSVYITLSLEIFVGLAMFFFLFGFIKMGKHTRSGFLKAMSWIQFIIYLLLVSLFVTISFLVSEGILFVLALSVVSGAPLGGFVGVIAILLMSILGLLALGLLMRYPFSIALLKRKHDVSFSSFAGWMGLIVALLLTVQIGFLIYISLDPFNINSVLVTLLEYGSWGVYGFLVLTVVLETIALFKASGRYEVKE